MFTLLTTKFAFLLAGCCMIGLANHVPQFSREINVINVKEEEPIGMLLYVNSFNCIFCVQLFFII